MIEHVSQLRFVATNQGCHAAQYNDFISPGTPSPRTTPLSMACHIHKHQRCIHLQYIRARRAMMLVKHVVLQQATLHGQHMCCADACRSVIVVFTFQSYRSCTEISRIIKCPTTSVQLLDERASCELRATIHVAHTGRDRNIGTCNCTRDSPSVDGATL